MLREPLRRLLGTGLLATAALLAGGCPVEPEPEFSTAGNLPAGLFVGPPSCDGAASIDPTPPAIYVDEAGEVFRFGDVFTRPGESLTVPTADGQSELSITDVQVHKTSVFVVVEGVTTPEPAAAAWEWRREETFEFLPGGGVDYRATLWIDGRVENCTALLTRSGP